MGKVTNAHDAVMRLLGRYATSNDVINSLHLQEDGKLVPDGEFHFPRETVLVDHSGVHSMSSSNRSKVPGAEVKNRARVKVNKYLVLPTCHRRPGPVHPAHRRPIWPPPWEFHEFIQLIDANSLQ